MLELDPNNLEALHSLGNIYYHLQNPQEAILSYLKILKSGQIIRDIIMNICYIYIELAKQEKSNELMNLYLENNQEKIIKFAQAILEATVKGD